METKAKEIARYRLEPMPVEFVSVELYHQWLSPALDVRLKALVCYLADYLRPFRVRITSILRPDERGSVHAYGRGIDLIVLGGYAQGLYEKLADYINANWPYGDGTHLTAIAHDVGRGYHLHLQVKDRRFLEAYQKGVKA